IETQNQIQLGNPPISTILQTPPFSRIHPLESQPTNPQIYHRLVHQFATNPNQQNSQPTNPDQQITNPKDNDIIDQFKKGEDPHLLVAALIATVTLATGFTMPSGYIDEKGPDQGLAILTNNSSYKAFLINNTIADTKETQKKV
ncbi:hypothetical protein CFP56_032905, partial [Quercus suber]